MIERQTFIVFPLLPVAVPFFRRSIDSLAPEQGCRECRGSGARPTRDARAGGQSSLEQRDCRQPRSPATLRRISRIACRVMAQRDSFRREQPLWRSDRRTLRKCRRLTREKGPCRQPSIGSRPRSDRRLCRFCTHEGVSERGALRKAPPQVAGTAGLLGMSEDGFRESPLCAERSPTVDRQVSFGSFAWGGALSHRSRAVYVLAVGSCGHLQKSPGSRTMRRRVSE